MRRRRRLLNDAGSQPATIRREAGAPEEEAARCHLLHQGDEWARQDSNLELTGYEPAVLTN